MVLHLRIAHILSIRTAIIGNIASRVATCPRVASVLAYVHRLLTSLLLTLISIGIGAVCEFDSVLVAAEHGRVSSFA